jgi:fructosamine-3-kinase
MFGGIPKSFFKAYHEHLPKTEPVDQYDLRAELYEFFHHLNHAVMFGVSMHFLLSYTHTCILVTHTIAGGLCE